MVETVLKRQQKGNKRRPAAPEGRLVATGIDLGAKARVCLLFRDVGCDLSVVWSVNRVYMLWSLFSQNMAVVPDTSLHEKRLLMNLNFWNESKVL